jgi:hypothetical protein
MTDASVVTLQVLIHPVFFVHSIFLTADLHSDKRFDSKPVFVMTLQVGRSDMAASW